MYKAYHTRYGSTARTKQLFFDDILMNLYREYTIVDPVISPAVGVAGSFSFTVPMGNAEYDLFHDFVSYVDVYDGDDIAFSGRVYQSEKDFYGNLKITCEGVKALLNDSVQAPRVVLSGNMTDLITAILGEHNAQVNTYAKIYVGRVTVTKTFSSSDLLTFDGYESTLSRIDWLCENFDGYVDVYRDPDDGKLYLNYLEEYTEESSQTIDFGENLLDLVQSTDNSELVTIMRPVGATVAPQRVTLALSRDLHVAREESEFYDPGQMYLYSGPSTDKLIFGRCYTYDSNRWKKVKDDEEITIYSLRLVRAFTPEMPVNRFYYYTGPTTVVFGKQFIQGEFYYYRGEVDEQHPWDIRNFTIVPDNIFMYYDVNFLYTWQKMLDGEHDKLYFYAGTESAHVNDQGRCFGYVNGAWTQINDIPQQDENCLRIASTANEMSDHSLRYLYLGPRTDTLSPGIRYKYLNGWIPIVNDEVYLPMLIPVRTNPELDRDKSKLYFTLRTGECYYYYKIDDNHKGWKEIPRNVKMYLSDSINIKTVNNGSEYLENSDAIAKYGRVVGGYTWDDVDTPAKLLSKAQKLLPKLAMERVTINATAVDLYKVGSSITKFRVGQKVRVKSSFHNIDTKFLVVSQDLNLIDPSVNQMSLSGSKRGYIKKNRSTKNYKTATSKNKDT